MYTRRYAASQLQWPICMADFSHTSRSIKVRNLGLLRNFCFCQKVPIKSAQYLYWSTNTRNPSSIDSVSRLSSIVMAAILKLAGGEDLRGAQAQTEISEILLVAEEGHAFPIQAIVIHSFSPIQPVRYPQLYPHLRRTVSKSRQAARERQHSL